MMKYWHYKNFDEAMDQGYINAMMLNATIPSNDDKGDGAGSSDPISFFDFGKKLAGLN